MFLKNVLFALLLIQGFSKPIVAQSNDLTQVPPRVLDQFILVYPDAKSIVWQFSDPYYVAVFRNNKMETTAIMTTEGIMAKTETEIKTTALPEEALDYLNALTEEPKITWASIREDQEGIITFEAIVDKKSYTFDAGGHVLVAPPGTQSLPDRF